MLPDDLAKARALVEEGYCPFCGAGPFRVMAIHAQKVHGVEKHQLRDHLLVTYNTRICDPTYSAECSARSKARWEAGNRPGSNKGHQQGHRSRAALQAIRRWAVEHHEDLLALAESGRAARIEQQEEERAALMEAYGDGESLGSIAQRTGTTVPAIRARMRKWEIAFPAEANRRLRNQGERASRLLALGEKTDRALSSDYLMRDVARQLGISMDTLRRALKASGHWVDGRTRRGRVDREKLAVQIGEGLRVVLEHRAEGRRAIVKAYLEGETLEGIAARLGVQVENVRRRLKREGVQPAPRQRKPPPRTPPRLCEVPGCQQKHAARGLCRLHYKRARDAARKGVTPC